MPLAPGTRLGPYEILALIGAGGMGEVYKARDTRLDRTVAIKVLPAKFAADPHLRERFDREAQIISRLDHAHICALYDIGEQQGTSFLVIQYLEGETLADRIAKGSLPPKESLAVAVQIADALDMAHRAGIVHRDLKPGNVMLTKSGAKLLDFGLSTIRGGVAAGAGLSMLPTTPPNLTAQGTILGTFQYMAPEQLEGKEADARTDIFAFGAVLYEMLTGKRAFGGSSHASLISSIMSSQPLPVSVVQTLVPVELDQLIAGCLAKDPEDRWQSARDVKRQLAWIAEARPSPAMSSAVGRSSRERLAWVLAGLAAIILFGTLATMLVTWRAPAVQIEPSQFVILPPEKASFNGDLAMSLDGRQLAFVASGADGTSRLWVRRLDSLTSHSLAGTDGASQPFWSPDGRSLGFFAGGKLKKIDVGGGGAQTLADASFPLGGTWNRDNLILFGPSIGSALLRISAGGGPAAQATSLDQTRLQGGYGAPVFLPDGRHFLFAHLTGPSTGDMYVGSLDSKNVKLLLPSTSAAAYSPPGYVLFPRGSTLMAQPFDVGTLSTSGEPVLVTEGVTDFTLSGFAVSDNGTLVYRSGAAGLTQLVWVNRAGQPQGLATPAGTYDNVSLSSDDKRVVFDRVGPTGTDLWLTDLERRITQRVTSQPPVNNVPIWSPDGRTIVFASSRNGLLDLYQRLSNLSAPDEPLLKLNAQPIVFPSDWSGDGRFLAYYRTDPKTQLDMWMLPLGGDHKPFPFLHGDFNESQGQFSPDGRWMAYVSDESGGPQVNVQSFPTLTGQRQVSTEGGTQPRWRRDGKELFYLAPDRKLMAVTVKTGATFEAEAPRAMFLTPLNVAALRQTYSVAADGQRFLLNTPLDTGSPPMTVVLNWPSVLKKK